MAERINRVLLLCATIGIWILVLQNANLVPPLKEVPTAPIEVYGHVELDDVVEIEGEVSVSEVWDAVDVNLSEVAGYGIVASQRGMFIGVSSADGKIIPIHWGEISTY